MTPKSPPICRDLLWITLSLCLLFGAFLGTRPLMVPDEGRYAEIPREMVESGDYLTPRLNYLKYFEKPPLFYWMEAAAIKIFGLNEWPLRAMVAITALLGCLMLYLAGLKLYDRRTGILACFMLASSLLYAHMARFIITDMPLTLWLTVALLLFILGTRAPSKKQRYYFWGMYACAALAVLSKGLVGVVLPGLVIFIWICATNQWRQLKTYCLPSGIVLFLLIAAPWHVLMQLKNPEFFHFYFVGQHFLRYFTDYAGRQQEVWFFPTVTLLGFFPWICFLLAFLFSRRREIPMKLLDVVPRLVRGIQKKPIETSLRDPANKSRDDANSNTTLFFILWICTLFIFFCLSKSLLLPYALPLMPPLALLTARYFSLHWKNTSDKIFRNGFFLLAGLGILISVGALIAVQLNALPSTILLYVTVVLFLISTLGSAIIYARWGIRAAVIALIISISACFITSDVAYPQVDIRSIKTLALTLKPRLKPDTEIAVYHDYHQDLPAYLGRRITVVKYTGELVFGTQQEDTRAWMIDENTLWQRWQNKPGMFMIMSLKDYADLQQKGIVSLYPVKQTARDILLTNTP